MNDDRTDRIEKCMAGRVGGENTIPCKLSVNLSSKELK